MISFQPDKQFSTKNLRDILILQQQLVERAVASDPSLVRSLKFKREIEAATAPYFELNKMQMESAKQAPITKYFLPSTSTK